MILPPTPGLVDTREKDFSAILDQSLQLGGGAPDASLYCRTSMVRKPVRSKYCSTSGFVVARFDHYCMWLNTAIGYGNHRTFMVFLYTHVAANTCFLAMLIKAMIRANDKTGPAFVVGQLLSQKYFFVTVLLAFVIVITAGLTFLMVEQTTNIVRNVTTNERINQSRYAWMKGPDGRPFNRCAFCIAYMSRACTVNTLYCILLHHNSQNMASSFLPVILRSSLSLHEIDSIKALSPMSWTSCLFLDSPLTISR